MNIDSYFTMATPCREGDFYFPTTPNTTNFSTCNDSGVPLWLDMELDVQNTYHPAPNPDIYVDESTLNFSNYEFPSKIWLHKPVWEIVSKVLTFLVFLVVGLFGNTLVVVVVARYHTLRTSTNLIMANLALADMATLLICPAMFIITDSFQNYEGGALRCKTEGFFSCMFLLTAVMNITAVSYHRLTVVVLPQEARFSKRGIYGLILATWIIGITASIPFIVYRVYKERQWANFLEKYCTENTTVLPYYWHVIIVQLMWLPLAIMLICYTTIVFKLWRYERELRNRRHPITAQWRLRVVRNTFVVLVVFTLSRAPYTALIFWRAQLLKIASRNQIVDDNFVVLWFISRYLLYINAAINPFIYGFSNEKFRRAVRHMELSRWLLPLTTTSRDISPTLPTKRSPQQAQPAHCAPCQQELPPPLPEACQRNTQPTSVQLIRRQSTECHMK